MVLILTELVTAPARGLAFVFESVHDAVEEEFEEERRQLRRRLRDLYSRFEEGELDVETFEAREDEILERLDELDRMMEDS